jgi:crotonobetainyl-CoA:carnitine CoA-transferase CaiB-like acyl-CoA transferase
VPGTGLPLEGLRVADITVAWSGPFTTMLLADLGAEVVRVENPWAFPSSTRGVYPRPTPAAVAAANNLNMSGYPDLDPGERPWNRSAVFNWHGRNKRSATLDIRKPSGRELLLRLLEVCDVLVENNPPKLLDALDLGYEQMAGRNPGLVVLRMPAGGLTGPYRDFVGFGGSFEGLVGLRSFRGYPTTSPEGAPGSLHMDTAAGATGTFAVLAALRRRRRSGQGALIDLSQLENLVQQTGEYVMAGARGVDFGPTGNRNDRHAPQGVYPCAGEDRWVAISVGSDEEWHALMRVMGDPAWADDATFSALSGRMASHDDLDERISAWTEQMDRYDVFHRCQAAGIAAAPVMDEADLYADPQLAHIGFFRPLESPHTGRHSYPAHPLRWSGPPLRWDGAAPGLGDDNDYVFRQLLGLTEDEYEQLAAEGHLSQDYLDREGNQL